MTNRCFFENTWPATRGWEALKKQTPQPAVAVAPREGRLFVGASLLATRSVVQGAGRGRLQAGSYTEREPVNHSARR